ncbi:MAG: hypothetical protein ACYSR9_15260, partial [Planctomycetota bacterium]
MNKNLTLKFVLITVLIVLAAWTLYPPDKTLKPGIDLAGGTSLIYEIDTHGLEETEKTDLAQRMITVLRRRIDPANIQNLVWRPQGNSRFEIQMPLASAEARAKRQNYEKAESNLLAKNISRSKIMRYLNKPLQERTEAFNDVTRSDPNKLTILKTLATAYDERKNLQEQRDDIDSKLQAQGSKLETAGLDLNQIKANRNDWAKLNEQQLQDSLREVTDANDNLALLTEYVKTYAEWSKVIGQLTDPTTGKNIEYKEAIKTIDKLNLTTDQLNLCLEIPAKKEPVRRKEEIEKLKTDFPDRADEIDNIVAAFDEYHPFKGRLDDPKDLQRMLKGAGILEFRILPTQGHPEADSDQLAGYVESLEEKGPKYASDNKYLWCEIEKSTNVTNAWMAADEQGRPFTKVRDDQGRPSIIAS